MKRYRLYVDKYRLADVFPEFRPIVVAANGDDKKTFDDLLETIDNINTVIDIHGNSLLKVMIITGRVDILRRIIDRAANLDTILAATDQHGNTPLHLAAYHGNKIMFEALTSGRLRTSASQRLKARNIYNQTPAMVAPPNLLTSIIEQLNRVESSRARVESSRANVAEFEGKPKSG